MKSIIASLLVLSVFGLMGPNAFADVPDWVKNNAGWWADGQINDDTFVQGIQFLIKAGIIVVNNN